jgi:hypothetical protein
MPDSRAYPDIFSSDLDERQEMVKRRTRGIYTQRASMMLE